MRVVKSGPQLNVSTLIWQEKDILYIQLDITNKTQTKSKIFQKQNLIEQLSVVNSTVEYDQIQRWGAADVMHSCQVIIPCISVKISSLLQKGEANAAQRPWGHVESMRVWECCSHWEGEWFRNDPVKSLKLPHVISFPVRSEHEVTWSPSQLDQSRRSRDHHPS